MGRHGQRRRCFIKDHRVGFGRAPACDGFGSWRARLTILYGKARQIFAKDIAAGATLQARRIENGTGHESAHFEKCSVYLHPQNHVRSLFRDHDRG